jgi:hypothetical protein
MGDEISYQKTTYDLGLMFKATILEREDAKLAATVGAGFLNLGGEYEIGRGETSPLPKTYRYGLGMQ